MAIECCMMKTCPTSSVSHIDICKVRNQKFYKMHCIIHYLLPLWMLCTVYVSVHVLYERNLVNFVNMLLLIHVINLLLQLYILGLQPRDKVTLLGVNKIDFSQKNLHKKEVKFPVESNAFFLTTNMATVTSGANQQCLQPLFTSTSTCLLRTMQCTIKLYYACTMYK